MSHNQILANDKVQGTVLHYYGPPISPSKINSVIEKLLVQVKNYGQ